MFDFKKHQYVLAAAVLSISTVSTSKEISYDFIQGTYASVTVDTGTTAGDLDGNGLAASGSFNVAPAIALTASFGATSFDRLQGIEIDTTAFSFGVTAHTSVSPGTDVFGNFSVLLADIELSDGFTTVDDDDTGNIISIGLRHLATEKVELEVGFSRTDVFDDTANTFGVGVRFYANDKFSLGIGYATGDDVDTLLLNARIDIK